MSREDLWNRAAEAMKADTDPRWQAVGSWLRAEAHGQEEMEPFVELLNLAMEQKSGVKSYLRFGRKPDGDVVLQSDTNEAATEVARAYLEETP